MTRDKEKRNNCLNRAGFDKLRVVLSDLSSIKNKTGEGGGGVKIREGGSISASGFGPGGGGGFHIR